MMNVIKNECICNKCAYVNECEYYKYTLEPIIGSLDTSVFDAAFSTKIINVLGKFKCQCFDDKDIKRVI